MKITVLGAGAWGTAFGQVLADAGNDVTMWAIEPEIVEGIRDRHHNAVRLPSVERLPENMTATGDRAEAVRDAEIIIVSIAAQAARLALEPFRDLIPGGAIVVSLMKGIERTTGKRMDEVVTEALGLPEDRFAAVSGPNLSKEIAAREPAATVVACANIDNARRVAHACTTHYFKAFVTQGVRDHRRHRIGDVRVAEERDRARRWHGARRGVWREHGRDDRDARLVRDDRPGQGGRRRSQDVLWARGCW